MIIRWVEVWVILRFTLAIIQTQTNANNRPLPSHPTVQNHLPRAHRILHPWPRGCIMAILTAKLVGIFERNISKSKDLPQVAVKVHVFETFTMIHEHPQSVLNQVGISFTWYSSIIKLLYIYITLSHYGEFDWTQLVVNKTDYSKTPKNSIAASPHEHISHSNLHPTLTCSSSKSYQISLHCSAMVFFLFSAWIFRIYSMVVSGSPKRW